MVLSLFQPTTARWFEERFGSPTDAQRLGWPSIVAGKNTLIAAPTGSGKTLAAFLACLDSLLRQGRAGPLPAGVQVVYVSPLKALSNDIQRNLAEPLAELADRLRAEGRTPPEIRVLVRTGDTPASQRQAMTRRPPHILVTTPESLYLVLTGAKSREMLRTVHTVIVDEIHALARDRRGSHLALSLERLERLAGRPLVRIGLSATQRPMEEIARFLVGTKAVTAAATNCQIIDVGHTRALDLAVEAPPEPLAAVCTKEMWEAIHERLAQRIAAHRSTLIFVNTRRLVERVGYQLAQRLGPDAVASHHGSLARATRLAAEERLKAGQLKAIVATASLELGIDVGAIDLVCQLGSPRGIATLLQRIGRAGHAIGAVPKGRLFPLTRDDLIECLALVRAVRAGRLDRIEILPQPLDILAQQLVAAVATEDWHEDDLFDFCRRAWPYRQLSRADFAAVLDMLSERQTRSAFRGVHLHRDRINGRIRATRGARLIAATCGGAIPDNTDYRVVTGEDGAFVGTINEDFAIESMIGDVFLLGNTSWKVQRIRSGEVVVEDAGGAPATVPFWLGEAPGRTPELSAEVASLRAEIGQQLAPAAARPAPDHKPVNGSPPATTNGFALEPATAWLEQECGAERAAGRQAAEYVAAQLAAVGLVPTQSTILFERFFDETGGMQLVVHAPFGMRINRAWGLALRKRFCRTFDFELQASADDNGIVLSMGPQHSCPLEQFFGLVSSKSAQPVLEQAVLAVPLFQIRWRWNVVRAFAVLRQRGGKRVPPPLLRYHADDFLSAVFPAQTACKENVVGDLPIPDHPLVRQTMFDCLREAMDLDGWLALLRAIEAGQIEVVGRETREPSPFSHERLHANPYSFLDDAPLEERRARAVATRRTLSPQDFRDLARLDPEAIEQVRLEAWPLVRAADELHEALLSFVALPEAKGAPWHGYFQDLRAAGRAARLELPGSGAVWLAAECWPTLRALFPAARPEPWPRLPPALDQSIEADEAVRRWVHGLIECAGPTTTVALAQATGLPAAQIEQALERLELEGLILRGQFTAGAGNGSLEWCERRLLARIHRLTLEGVRRQIQPVAPADFLRFLCRHHALTPDGRLEGRQGLRSVIEQLQGFELPAGSWELDILPSRVADYDPAWLDDLSLQGEVSWGRLQPPAKEEGELQRAGLTRVAPLSLFCRHELAWLLPPQRPAALRAARGNARAVYDSLAQRGALFFDDIARATRLLPAELDEALSELAALGLINADGFAALRRLATASREKHRFGRSSPARARANQASRGGRWSCFPSIDLDVPADRAERWAQQLLRRYGVIFRDLLTRETAAPPWSELVPHYRRLEARGAIRGGRFVAAVAGEQYALLEAVERLRAVRSAPDEDAWLRLAAADPVNLVGIVTAGPRIPATRGNSLILRAGRLVASRQAGAIQFHEPTDAPVASLLRQALERPAAYSPYPLMQESRQP